MKNYILLLMMLLPIGMCAQVDDMYFIPKKKAKSVTVNTNASQEHYYDDETMDVDAYNRRYAGEDYESGDEAQYTEYYDDTEYTYSSRIVRFHSPRRVMLSSPLYWDVV